MDSFDISNIWYGRTVIHSSYKLTYELAQRIYDSVTAENISSNSFAMEELVKKSGGLEAVKNDIPELKELNRVVFMFHNIYLLHSFFCVH